MTRPHKKLRVAVVGLGHFAQTAILPALAHTRSVELVALVSGDPDKLRVLGDQYRVPHRVGYQQYDELLAGGHVDAVYIALPPDLHADYTVRAAAHEVHVLCEKPMAPTEEECEAMIGACADAGVKLMVAYRLHFEAGNLGAIEALQKEEIGEPRVFSSTFTMQVREGNIRVQPRPGAGPLFDLGIYCVNAARYLFREEPHRVTGMVVEHPGDPRFAHVEETVAAVLNFPSNRIATFVASFGAADHARYEVIGTRGTLQLDHAYDYAEAMKLEVTTDHKPRIKRYKKRDQVAAEIEYFARCVRDDVEPEPSGREGLADVRIMLAIYQAARSGAAVDVAPVADRRPVPAQEIHVPPASGKPPQVDIESPSE